MADSDSTDRCSGQHDGPVIPSRGAVRRAAWIAGLLAAAAGLAAATTGCSSLSKADMEARLLELDKNAPARAVGLTRLSTPISLDGEVVADEIVYLHAPRAADAPPGTLPIVLIHGTPSTLFAWTDLTFGGLDFEGLRAQRDVYAIEVAGHGIAPGDAGPYGFERCARFAGEVVKALGLERFHVVGSSYGGEFAWRLALNEPDRVASLVLLDSSGYERRDEDWLSEEVVMRENSLAGLGWLLNSRDRIESALAPHFREIPPDRVEEFFLVCENRHNWGAMVDLARDENGSRQGDLRGLRAPTLLLWGADDLAYPPEVYARRFADDIPDAELIVLEGTGHYPHDERPADVIHALNRFFADQEVSQ
jgi:pimeloyl-ACP methyl ester carboxylesterase